MICLMGFVSCRRQIASGEDSRRPAAANLSACRAAATSVEELARLGIRRHQYVEKFEQLVRASPFAVLARDTASAPCDTGRLDASPGPTPNPAWRQANSLVAQNRVP